jgi:hypothetical protein
MIRHLHFRLPLAMLGAVLLIGAAGEDDPEAVLLRTKETTATYAAYAWHVERDDEGAALDSAIAEFHSGDWHRVDGPKYRLLANCKTHVGYVYDVATGETGANDRVYLGACGIATDEQILSVDRLPFAVGKYGTLDVIRVTSRTLIRYYAIDQRGVIIRSQWTAANGSPAPCTQTEPIAILAKLPPGEIFSKASLARSVIAERYRKPPRDLPASGLSGKNCAAVG